ncbi:MAG: hypothetical protein HN867_08920, partial [Deltaproteobacteria bacterium]|nr:hypothetical protein [Deltaproteobacteria bacterium]
IITNVDDKFSPATKIAMETSGSTEAAAYDSGDASFNVVDETSDLTFNIAGEGTADLPGLSSFKFVVDFSEQLKFFSGDFFSSDEFTFELAASRGTAVTLNDGGTGGDTSDDTVVQRYVVSATTKEGVDTTESGVITFNNSFKTDSGRVISLEDRNGNTLSTEGQFLFHNGVLSTLDSSELASGISISGFNVDGNKPATPDVSIEDSARLNPTTGVAETGLDTDGITKDAVLNIGTAFENGASVAVRVTTETGSDGDITDWVDWSNATSSLDLVADLSLTLSNGEAYRVDVRQQDASGNYSDILALSFTYDKVIGAITLVNSDSLQDNNLISDDEFTLSVSDADPDSSVKFEYSADGGTTWEALSGGNVAGLADGTYDFKATATDTAGNLAVDQLSNITVDKTAPTLDIKVFVKNESGAWIESTVASVATNDDVKFEFDFSETVIGFDQNDIVISGVDQDAINNGNFSSSSEDYTLELAPTADVASGQISVAVNASSTPGLASGITDTAGNMLSSDVDISASQAFDTKAPTIVSIIGPTAAEYSLGDTVKFTVNFSENIIPMNGSNVQNTVDHKVEFFVGGQARAAYLDENYTNSEKVAWNETNTLEFSYTIVADDGAGGTAENKAVQFDSIKGAYVDSLGNASNVSTLGNPNDFANFTNLYFNGSVSMQQADGYIANSTILAEQPDGTFNVGIGDEIGGAQLFGQAGPMQVFGGQDISTGLDFNVMYESPFGFTVTNPISTLVRSIQKQQTVDTLKVFSVNNGDAALDGNYVFLTNYGDDGSSSGKKAVKVEKSTDFTNVYTLTADDLSALNVTSSIAADTSYAVYEIAGSFYAQAVTVAEGVATKTIDPPVNLTLDDHAVITHADNSGNKETVTSQIPTSLFVTAESGQVDLSDEAYASLSLDPSKDIGVYSLSDAVDNNSDGTPEYIWNNDAWFSINQDAYIKAYPVIFGGSEVIGTWRDLDLSADGFNGIATYDPFAASTDSSATTSDKQDAVSYQRGAASLATFVEVLSDAMATMDSLDLNESGDPKDQKAWSSEVYAAVSELLVAGNLTTYISSGETVALSNLLSKETFVQDAIEVVFQIYEPSFSSDNVGNYGDYFEAAKAILTFSGEQIASTYSDTAISDWSALEALTKITQVQQVSQGDSGEILTHFIGFVDDPDSFKNSTNFFNKGNPVTLDTTDTSWEAYSRAPNTSDTEGNILPEGIGYTQDNLLAVIAAAKVGVLVPTSYSIENSGAKILREGSSSDDAQTLSFTVTRGGNTEVPSSISWKIKASDYFDVSKFGSETLPTGTIDFDAGDAQKVIT